MCIHVMYQISFHPGHPRAPDQAPAGRVSGRQLPQGLPSDLPHLPGLPPPHPWQAEGGVACCSARPQRQSEQCIVWPHHMYMYMYMHVHIYTNTPVHEYTVGPAWYHTLSVSTICDIKHPLSGTVYTCMRYKHCACAYFTKPVSCIFAIYPPLLQWTIRVVFCSHMPSCSSSLLLERMQVRFCLVYYGIHLW